MPKFLSNINLESANDVQFKTAAGVAAGKIEQDGNDLVLSNAVGDVLLGDGASDVYIGDGANSVDILFEQSGSIKAEDGSNNVTLTLGSSDTTLALGSSILSALNVGVNNTGYDVTFYGATSGKKMLWDESDNTLVVDGTLDVNGNATILTGGLSGSLTVGRDADQNILIYVDDNNTKITGVQDSDTNGAHNFILDRTFEGSGANNFIIQKGGTAQLTLDTSGNATFAGTIGSGAITSTAHVAATEFRPTNIVTNKVVKFNGAALDDANITDTGSLITLGSDTVVSGELEATSLDINGSANISGLLTWSGTDYGDAINLSEGDINNVNEINAYEFKQRATGEPRSNLGSPTVTEMGLFDSQFTPKTTLANGYDDLADLKFFTRETGSNESDYAEVTTYSDDEKRKFLRTNNSSVIIDNTHNSFRVEFVARGYTHANAMYAYWSSQSHNTQVQVYKYNVANSAWVQHTSSTTTVSSWPGHLYLPFSQIPWDETETTSTTRYEKIRIEFTPTWVAYSGSGTDYSARDILLYGMQIWGGYPGTHKRTVHSYDQNGKLDLFKDFGLPDDGVATFGSGDDLKIWHDGSNSYIVDAGTGDLLNYFSNDWKVIKYGSSEICIAATSDGSVDLYYDNSKKLETVTGGVLVTGELEATTLDINGNADISGNLTGLDNVTSTNFIIGGHTIDDVDVAGEFVDSANHLITSAAANDRFAQINANTTGSSGSCTGNAATATLATQATNLNATDDRDMAPEDYAYSDDFRVFFTSKEGLEDGTSTGTNYQDALYINSYSDATGGDANVLAFDKSEKKIYHYQADQAATNWGTAKQLAYTDSDVSGDTTGNAATATTLATARALQVTLTETDSANFNGSADVTDIGVTGTLAVGNGGTGVTSLTALKNALDDETWSFANNVTLSGFVLDSNTITGVNNSNEFDDDDAHIMTSAAINDRFAQINADTTGEAGTVATITGLAPDTATTEATQPNITTMTGVFTGSNNYLITDNGDGTVTSESQLTYNGAGGLKISTGDYSGSPSAHSPIITLENSDPDAGDCPKLLFVRRTTGADGQDLGSIEWSGDNDANEIGTVYASILGEISDASDGAEGGKLSLGVASHDGGVERGLILEDGNADGEVDVTIAAGVASTTTISGELIAKRRRFDITASGTNGDGNGDIIYFGTIATSLVAGTIYYYASNGEWTLTDANTADSAKSKGLLGVALGTTIAEGILLRGVVTLVDVGDPETVGLPLFLSGDVGQATTTRPSANGDTVRILGYLLDDANDMAWFNPDNTFVEVTA